MKNISIYTCGIVIRKTEDLSIGYYASALCYKGM